MSFSLIISSQNQFPTMEETEEALIMLALKETKGRRDHASELIGMNVRTLAKRLKLYRERAERKHRTT